jgi:hypothetical protein
VGKIRRISVSFVPAEAGRYVASVAFSPPWRLPGGEPDRRQCTPVMYRQAAGFRR